MSRYNDLTSLFVKDFVDAQNLIGLTPDFLAVSLKRLITSKKTECFKASVPYGPDVVIYSKPLPDHATRLKALTMALNIRGVQTASPQNSTMTLRGDPEAPVIWEGVDMGYLARGIKDQMNGPTSD